MQTGMSMKEMAAALARQPEAARRTMLGDRMQMFYEKPEAERVIAMRMMIEGIYSLSDDDMYKIVATRTALLAELPEEKRQALMMAHMQAIQAFPEEQRMKEIKMVQEAVAGLPQAQKQVMMRALQGMMSGDMAMSGGMATARDRAMAGGRPAAPVETQAEGQGRRWITFALGLWAVLAAFIFDYGAGGGALGQAIGGIVAALFPLLNTAYWLTALAGVWLIIAPFIFGVGGVAQIVGILTGIAIAWLAGTRATRRS
jgi:hypothetical protein